jgi:maltose-binding protein MalE
MVSIRSVFAAFGLTSALFIGASLVVGQNSKSEHDASAPVSAPLLRTIVVRHPGCITCTDETISSEREYLNKHVKERPTIESVYDQKKVDDMKQALEAFWKQMGIAVEVSTRLTQIASAPHYAILEFDVYRTF